MDKPLDVRMYEVAHMGGGVPTMHQFDTWIKEVKELLAENERLRKENEQLEYANAAMKSARRIEASE